MDVRVWMEQVEAALVPGNEAILSALVRLAPQPTPPGAGLVLARALIATGQHDRALELVPAKPSTQDSRAWAAAASDLALAGRRPNDPALSRTLLDLAAQADPPDAFDIVEQHVRLCLARGARQVALRGLDHLAATMDRRSPRHPPLSGRRRRAADQAIAELRAEILASTAPPAVDPQERRLDELAGDSSPAALSEAAACWEALGDEDAAIAPFRRAVEQGSSDPSLLEAWGQRLVLRRDLAALTELVETHFGKDGPSQALAHWLLAQARFSRGALPAARSSLNRLLALRPGDRDGRLLLARAMRADGQQDQALELLETLAAEQPQDLAVQAERLELAALAGRTDSEAQAAASLGLSQVGGPCRVRLPWSPGERAAERLSAVRARLLPGGEVVILRLAEQEPARDERGPLFEALRTLRQAGSSSPS